jgi:D-alanyl-lipoteichoic acid acyltransferase DltB (MBOAT superfamily)
MLTASAPFLLFSLVMALFYHVRRAAAWRQACFLAANLLFLANYTLNFSTLVSGPIQRYQDFIDNRPLGHCRNRSRD